MFIGLDPSMNDFKASISKHYGWIVTSACFCLTLIYAVTLSFGVFLDPIIKEFGWSNAVTSGVYSTYWIFWTVSGLVTGTLADRYSPRLILSASAFLAGLGMALSASASTVWHLYLSFGVMGGLGAGGVWTPAMTLTMRWFKQERKLSWAVSLVALGSATGTMFVVPLEGMVIPSYGWRAAYGFVALLIWGIALVAAILIRDPPKLIVTQSSRSGFSESLHGMKTRSFLFLLISYAIVGGWARQDVLVHIVSSLSTEGFAYVVAASSLVFVGGGSAFGRLLIGPMGKKMGEKAMLFLFYSLQGLSILLLTIAHNLDAAHLSSFLFGIAYGGAVCVVPLIVTKAFGTAHFGAMFGVLMIGLGAGAVLGPIFGGYLYDLTRTYYYSFLADVSLSFVGAGLFLLSLPKMDSDGRR
jgi:MFS family permease